MFELFSDIYFVVYKLYYVGQNDNLGIRVNLKNWDRGNTSLRLAMSACIGCIATTLTHDCPCQESLPKMATKIKLKWIPKSSELLSAIRLQR
jgi:hypothetical protein